MLVIFLENYRKLQISKAKIRSKLIKAKVEKSQVDKFIKHTKIDRMRNVVSWRGQND